MYMRILNLYKQFYLCVYCNHICLCIYISFCVSISIIYVGWLGFNGISTSIGYLMPKPVYTYVRFANTKFNDIILKPNDSFTRVNIFKYFCMTLFSDGLFFL